MRHSTSKARELDNAVATERRRQHEADLHALMATPSGRRFYWGLMEKTNVLGGSYVDSASRTAWLEGRRSIGYELMAEVLKLAPAEHVLTLKEALESKHADESRRRASDSDSGDDENGD